MEGEQIRQFFGINYIGKEELRSFFKVIFSLLNTLSVMNIFGGMTSFRTPMLNIMVTAFMLTSTMI